MASKNKKCLLCGLLVLVMFVSTSTQVCFAAGSDDVEAMRQEIEELKQMVRGLAKEVKSLKEAKGQESSQQAQYQRELDEIRTDVTKLNESPMAGLADTLGKVKLGGYGEVHSNFNEGSESDQIDFHRMVLYLGYEFADWIMFHSETELEHAFVNDGDGEISLEQAYVDFLLSDKVNVRAGRVLTPIGIINQYHEPTLFSGVERPLFATAIIPTTWSSDGIGFFGSLDPSLSYEAYVVAGLDGSGFNETTGIRGGRIKERPSLNEPAFTGRLDYRPCPDQDLRLGLSGYFGGLNNGDQGNNPGAYGEIALVSADFEYSVSKFDFRGAIANINLSGANNLGGSNNIAEEIFGWYVEGAYHFWPEEWKKGKLAKSDATVFVRYDDVDTQHEMPSGVARNPAGAQTEWTFGTNFYLTNNFVIKADYKIRDDDTSSGLDDQFNLGLGWAF